MLALYDSLPRLRTSPPHPTNPLPSTMAPRLPGQSRPAARLRGARSRWVEQAFGGTAAGLIAWLGITSHSPTLRAADLPARKHSTVIIAHRGEHLRHQENTLPAIQGAIDAGADFTEMDVRRSRDGEYLLMHDATVDRMTNGHGKVADLNWSELSKLVVQDRRLTNVPPSRIPLFREALPECRGRIHIYLDFKAGDRQNVADLVHAAGMELQVIVYDSAKGLAEWSTVAPNLALITSPPRNAAKSKSVLADFVNHFHPQVLDEASDAAFVADAVALGVLVWPDIQRHDEEPAYWQSIWDRGVRGFQTDHPAELAQWLEKEGRR